MSKRAIVSLLVVVNLVLLATLILGSWRLPAAYAQAVPMGNNFLMVAGEVINGTDALYVFDLSKRRMHVFLPNQDQNSKRVVYRSYRDLETDFRRGAGGGGN